MLIVIFLSLKLPPTSETPCELQQGTGSMNYYFEKADDYAAKKKCVDLPDGAKIIECTMTQFENKLLTYEEAQSTVHTGLAKWKETTGNVESLYTLEFNTRTHGIFIELISKMLFLIFTKKFLLRSLDLALALEVKT